MENVSIYDKTEFLKNDVGNVLKYNYCTDYVHLSEDAEKSLKGIWEEAVKNITVDGKKGFVIPSDLIFQNTIPLNDVTFIRTTNDTEVIYRVHIFSNCDEFLSQIYEHGKTCVGIVDIFIKEYGYHYYVGISIWEEYVNILCPAYMGCPDSAYISEETQKNDDAVYQLHNLANNILGFWYSIQLCLLNPVTQVIFSKPTFQKLHGKDKIEAQKIDKSIKYVKHYYIKEDDVDNVLYGGDRSFNRKCLVWYVTGHWREYKTGKRTFIKGYFKGALRNTPNEDVARKRELVFTDNRGNINEQVQVV